jgi:malate synthase
MKFAALRRKVVFVGLGWFFTFLNPDICAYLSGKSSQVFVLRRVRESGRVVINPAVKAKYAGLFGDKIINGRTLNVEQMMATLTTEFGPQIANVLAARRQLLESTAKVSEKYGLRSWSNTFKDPVTGRVWTRHQIVQGLIDNYLGRDTPLRWRANDNKEAPIPDQANPLKKPGLTITGPWAPLNMAFNQLNADAAKSFRDEEDASPAWYVPFGAVAGELPPVWQGRQNTKEILAGEWGDGTAPREFRLGDKVYTLQKPRGQWPTPIHRVPGIHLEDPYVMLNGKPVPAMIVSNVIDGLNNYGSLKKAGSGLYYYQPKAQTGQEAILVENLLRSLEDSMGIPKGSIKIEMIYEEGVAGLDLPVIVWAWRERFLGSSNGRWDYLGSLIEMWKDEAVFPDPQTIIMTAPNMMAYQRWNTLVMLMAGMKDGQLTNAGGVGGMAAVMLYPPTDPYGRFKYNPKALRAIKLDKLRERLIGLVNSYDVIRQSWVATKDEAYMASGNGPLRAVVGELQAMIDAPIEMVQVNGQSVPTVASGLIPAERQLFQSLGLLGQDGKITPWLIRKDQIDTPEKLFSSTDLWGTGKDLWHSLYDVPKGDITSERLQNTFFQAAQYGFQILNGNLAAAIDDYEALPGDQATGYRRFMNDLATYRIFVSWLWTVLHHQAAVTKDGFLKQPALTENGVIPAVNSFEVKTGTRFTPELFSKLWDYHNEWTKAFFAEEDRRGATARFDRSKAPIIMEILKRQLTAPRYIQHSARVLFVLAEANDQRRGQLMEAIFSPSREEVVRKIQAGLLEPSVLVVHDYVYDIR